VRPTSPDDAHGDPVRPENLLPIETEPPKGIARHDRRCRLCPCGFLPVLLSSATLRPRAAAAAASAAKSHRRGTEPPKTLGLCLRRKTHNKEVASSQKHALPPSEPRVVVVVWSASPPPLLRRRRARPRAPPRVRVSWCTVPGAPCVPHPGRGTTKRTEKERDGEWSRPWWGRAGETYSTRQTEIATG